MGLCDICRGIGFDNAVMPPFPREYRLPGLPDDDDDDQLFYVELKDGYNPPIIFGYSHYQSLHDLKNSAYDDDDPCGLCLVIHQEFHERWKVMKNPLSHWRFFITCREHNQQGFQVWTDWHHGRMLRVGAFGYAAKNDDGSSFSRFYRGRMVSRYASFDACWDMAENWIDKCDEKHDNCPPGPADVELPTRLIYVGKDDNDLKIVETGTQSGSYVALSYSGGPQPDDGFSYRLTEANHDEYNDGIDIESTDLKSAKTIMQAIEITRKLGKKYLWVDALCIEQSPRPDAPATDDFHREAPKMAQYYSNAYLTIAAAASANSSAGLYTDRKDYIPENHYTFTHHNNDKDFSGKMVVYPLSLDRENILALYVLLEAEPIVKRAWTLQERALSSRTLFYASDQMYWECNQSFTCENGAVRFKGRMNTVDENTRKIDVWEDGRKQDPRGLWNVQVESYSTREMSRPSDKLVAIGGLASKFAKIFKDRYLAGLWEKTIIADLWWKPTKPFMSWNDAKDWSPSSVEYRAPSWSWAAFNFEDGYDGGIAPTADNRAIDAEEVGVYKGNTVKVATASNSFGTVKSGELQLNIPVLRLRLNEDRTHLSRREFAFTWEKRELHHKATLDFKFNSVDEVNKLEIQAAVLSRTTDDGTYLCILITPVTDSANYSDSYRRLGTMWIRESDLGRHGPDFEGLWWYLEHFV
ncbi:HET-domain-containing protein [Agrocybe pediades]|nr:HET-domain-containing protein [Agrocybe pediades]